MVQFVNYAFGFVNHLLSQILFLDVFFFTDSLTFALIPCLLFLISIYLTFKMRFVNIRLFRDALGFVLGKKTGSPSRAKDGEITPFKALTTALSGSVGLGNIAGVAIAISTGGPGATFWMIIMGLLGMSTKFTECTLGIMYREKRPDGKFMGGPMEYLKHGLTDIGLGKLGSVLAVTFSLMCVGGSFGAGTAFQVNQSLNSVAMSIPFFGEHKWAYGLIMTILVGLVILGGIKRIALFASRIVPAMCTLYILMVLCVLIFYIDQIPSAFATILRSAFFPEAAYGGFLGVLVKGIQRATFSNEAGIGSSPIAHSAAAVSHPVEEGAVALLEPFIDTVIICTFTALMIIITGAYNNPAYMDLIHSHQGASITSRALSDVVSWFSHILTVVVFLFCFSTIISWSYYGERCFSYVFGDKKAFIYKWMLLAIVFLGSISTATNALTFGDLMVFAMAVPNLLGLILLSTKAKHSLEDYMANHRR